MKKYNSLTFLLLLLMLPFLAFSQVGINAGTPNASAVLDVNGTNKGVQIPHYDLMNLQDKTNPVVNPADGLIIFNEGGNSPHPRGLYLWTSDQWQRIILTGTEPQSFALQIVGRPPDTDNQSVIIPTNSGNNTLNYFTVVSNKITGASLGSDASTITLPAGKYLIKYGFDGVLYPTTGDQYYFGRVNVCTRAYITNSSNVALTNVNKKCRAHNVFVSYQGTLFLELTETTPLKFKFEFDNGNGLVANPLRIRTNFVTNIIRMIN